MIEFIVKRHGTTIAVVNGHQLPYRASRLILNGNEYEVVAVRHIYHTDKHGAQHTAELDPPEVHVNHIREM